MSTPEQEAYIEAAGEFRHIVSKVLAKPIDSVPTDFSKYVSECDDTVDALDLCEIVMAAEEHFGIRLVDQDEFEHVVYTKPESVGTMPMPKNDLTLDEIFGLFLQ